MNFDEIDPKYHEQARRGAMKRVSGAGFRFDVRPWYGDEDAESWIKRHREQIETVLRRHVKQRQKEAEELGLERVPPLKRPGRKYLDLAARWQVSGEDWGSFLEREDLLSKTTHNIKKQISEQLDFVGIQPRPGMLTVEPKPHDE